MGQTTRGIYPQENGLWQVDKWWKGERFRQRSFATQSEAENWLIRKLGEKRSEVVHGTRAVRTFDAAAAHYLRTHMDKVSIKTEAILLAGIMQFIGHLQLHQVHDSTLAPFTSARLAPEYINEAAKAPAEVFMNVRRSMERMAEILRGLRVASGNKL